MVQNKIILLLFKNVNKKLIVIHVFRQLLTKFTNKLDFSSMDSGKTLINYTHIGL